MNFALLGSKPVDLAGLQYVCLSLAQNNVCAAVLQIISTSVHEDGYELSLTVNFALRGTKDPFVGEKQLGLSGGDYLSSYTQGRKSSMSSYASRDSLGEAAMTGVSGFS